MSPVGCEKDETILEPNLAYLNRDKPVFIVQSHNALRTIRKDRLLVVTSCCRQGVVSRNTLM